MMTEKLKKLYEHPLFHGIKKEAEANAICIAEIEQFGKPGARTFPDGTQFDPKNSYIWFLLDEGEHYSPVIFRYCESSDVPFERVDETFHPEDCEDYDAEINDLKILEGNGVERRNPHKLIELTRATILDNCNLRPCISGWVHGAICNCCRRSLPEKIDKLEITGTEKMEIKKLTNLL